MAYYKMRCFYVRYGKQKAREYLTEQLKRAPRKLIVKRLG